MLEAFFEFCGNMIFLGGSLSLGALIASLFVSQTLYSKEDLSKQVYFEISEDERESDDDDNRNEIEKFMNMYSLEGVNNRELSEENIKEISSKHCIVETPAAEVLMTYNKPKFIYYAKNGGIIPYRFLDVVARKFVLDFDCVELYKEMVVEKGEPNNETENNNVEETNSVFVVKKKPVKAREVITKTMNEFKYGGQISDYKLLGEEKKEEPKKITFSDYKKMMKEE